MGWLILGIFGMFLCGLCLFKVTGAEDRWTEWWAVLMVPAVVMVVAGTVGAAMSAGL